MNKSERLKKSYWLRYYGHNINNLGLVSFDKMTLFEVIEKTSKFIYRVEDTPSWLLNSCGEHVTEDILSIWSKI